MGRRIGTAREHGSVAGQAFAEDEGRRLDVTLDCTVADAGRFRYEVHIASNHDPEAKTIAFDVDSPFDVAPPPLADVAALTAVFPALHHGGELRVEGTVSRTLVRNVAELQAAWVMARPDLYRPFRFVPAQVTDDAAPANARAIMPLTGGVDSMLTLCRHTDPARPLGAATEDVGAALFLPGFAPRPDRAEEYPAATQAVREIAALRGLPLAVVENNFLAVVRSGAFASGTLLGSALALFRTCFGRGLIAASVPYGHPHFRFFGTAAWVDPLYSSDGMALRDDGTDMFRVEKVAALSRYPEMLEHLLVCFAVKGMNANCGRCEKCVRTMLAFLAIQEAIPAAFPAAVDLDRVGKHLGAISNWSYAQQTLRAARALGTRHPAMARLARAYRVKRVKYELRKFLTLCVPALDLLRRDDTIPAWLVRRRARRTRRAEPEPWYRPG